MRTQPRLRTAPGNPTCGLQYAGNAEHARAYAPGPAARHHRHQTVEDHAGVIEDICGEAVALAFGVEGWAGAVREEDGCQARGRVLEGAVEEGVCGGCGGVADADACLL